jgi:hypothetical protein
MAPKKSTHAERPSPAGPRAHAESEIASDPAAAPPAGTAVAQEGPRAHAESEIASAPVAQAPSPAEVIAAALAAPFDAAEVKFKPQMVSGNRALAVPFVDARVIQDRLDDVLGVLNWQDNYECLPDGNVVCRLKVRIGGEWIVKEDVGAESEQPDEGDRRKASFSDALKRAAVKFGVGRYLYRQAPAWVDYDPQRKRFTGALPVVAGGSRPAAAAARAHAESEIASDPARELKALDASLAREGLIAGGALLAHVRAAVEAGGRPWRQSYQAAHDAAKAFEWQALFLEADRLLDASDASGEEALAHVGAAEGVSVSMLGAADLRRVVTWLRARRKAS